MHDGQTAARALAGVLRAAVGLALLVGCAVDGGAVGDGDPGAPAPAPIDWPAGAELLVMEHGTTSLMVGWPPLSGAGADGFDVLVDQEVRTSVSGDTTAATLAGLEPAHTYGIAVVALVDSEIVAGPFLEVTTLAATVGEGGEGPEDEGPPTWPPGAAVTAWNVTATGALLSWTAAEDDVAVTSYTVFGDDLPIDEVEAPATSLDVEGLEPGGTVLLGVEAHDEAGNVSEDGPELLLATPAGP